MTQYPALRSVLVLCLLVGGALLAGCDSGGDDDPEINVVGTYEIAALSFNPTRNFIPDANVRDTLNVAATTWSFSANNRFAINFQFQNGSGPLLLGGVYEVDGDRVVLNMNDEDVNVRSQLLLPDRLTMNALDTGATLQASTTVEGINMEQFSPRFDGYNNEAGVLTIRLER